VKKNLLKAILLCPERADVLPSRQPRLTCRSDRFSIGRRNCRSLAEGGIVVERLTLSYAATGELVELFADQLRRCKVQPGEHVLLHTDSGTYPHYPAAYLGAAKMLGADVFAILHPYGEEAAAIDAWKRADLVVDLTSRPHAYGEIIAQAQESGTRILRMANSEEVIRRLLPTQELRERVEAGQALMENAKTMRITSPGGTDLTFYKEGRHALGIYSVSDKPGRWDLWPSGMVNCAPEEDKGEGVLVLSPGDMMLVLQQYVRDPVHMEVEDGCIKSITGGLEAELLTEWFAKFKDPNAYRIAHIGWGCERRADWLKPGQDNECYYANMQIAFGANRGVFTQGTTRSKAHHDFPCRNNSYWCDDVQIMADGEFVRDELKYKAEDAEVREPVAVG
jgi:2,5-dihydroxypyridine 5,6-dioxygenase